MTTEPTPERPRPVYLVRRGTLSTEIRKAFLHPDGFFREIGDDARKRMPWRRGEPCPVCGCSWWAHPRRLPGADGQGQDPASLTGEKADHYRNFRETGICNRARGQTLAGGVLKPWHWRPFDTPEAAVENIRRRFAAVVAMAESSLESNRKHQAEAEVELSKYLERMQR